MKTLIKDFSALVKDGSKLPEGWRLKAVINDDNMTYVAIHDPSRELIVVDPMREDWDALVSVISELKGYRLIAVIDTHTHADHISNAAQVAERFGAPLVMHRLAPSAKVHLRVSRDVDFPSAAAPLKILVTPGHTGDSITPLWGPLLFGADTILHGDTGRDDLPGGDPVAHYASLQKIKAVARPETIFAPGHDGEGGRVTSWKTQLEINASLTQDEATFVREAGSYVGPSPKILKESLYENFK